MIQIITGDVQARNRFGDDKIYSVSDFRSPKAFDDFDLNILDLGFDDLWRNRSHNNDTINMLNDLNHYNNIIKNSNNTKILVIIPQNIVYKYYYVNDKYYSHEYLKNMLGFIEKLFINYIYSYAFQLCFETTNTTISKFKIKADFHFNKECFDNEEIILVSDNSKKLTTIKVSENLYYTTLDIIGSKEILEEFLKKTKISYNEQEERPDWICEINILDDVQIKRKINSIEEKIDEMKKQKEEEMEKLSKNEKIKSILYQTDKKLQNEVIEILNEILDYENNNFVDEMEEDFRIKKDDITFIIETKGLQRNIKGEDISKTSNHVEIYKDKIEEEGLQEEVKGLYIVATQRDRKIEEREKTPDRQITLAKRDNILIIRTEELLKIIEAFRNKSITTEEIIKIFSTQTGEFKYSKE